MIDLIFYLGTEIIFVRIAGRDIKFSNSSQMLMTGIEGLRLDYSGVVKEFPELEGCLDWKDQAIIKFKEKIREMKTEDEIAEYVINDLKRHGYIPKIKQKAGFRREVIHV